MKSRFRTLYFIINSILCIAIGVSVIATIVSYAGWKFNPLISLKQIAPLDKHVTELTKDVFKQSTFSGPLLAIVETSDGSFSYVAIKQATLKNNQLVGDMEVVYPNGDSAILSAEGTKVVLFFKKNGEQ